jgi:hypothetical protein
LYTPALKKIRNKVVHLKGRKPNLFRDETGLMLVMTELMLVMTGLMLVMTELERDIEV